MQAFLFERDFDQEMEAEGYVPSADLPVHYSEAQMTALLAKARQEAYAEGEAAGRVAALAEMGESLAADQVAALQTLIPQISTLLTQAGAHRYQIEQDLAAMCLFLAENLAPELLKHFGTQRLRAFCRQAIASAEGPLELRLAPQVYAQIAAEFETARPAQGAALALVSDESLLAGQAQAAWLGGRSEYDYQQMLDALLASFTSIVRDAAPNGIGS